MNEAAAFVALVGMGMPPACPHEKELELVKARFNTEEWRKLDECEEVLEQMPQEDCPLNHIFTPGLYCREIFMRKGLLITSRIHLTEHPYVISRGVVSVRDDEIWVTLRAPHTGITKPGTRRILYIHEDTIWSTFHVTNATDPDEALRQITYCGGKYQRLGGAAAKKELCIQ